MGFKEQGTGDFLRKATAGDLSAWLLQGLDFPGESLRDERSPVTLLCNEIKKTDKNFTQKKISQAVSLALNQWSPDVHTTETLKDLALVAATMRFEKTVPALVSVIDRHAVGGNREEIGDTEELILSVIAGFSEEKAAEQAMRRWYDDPGFDWTYTSILAIGLMKAAPEETASFLPKLFSEIEQHPGYFRLDYLTAAAAEATGTDSLEVALRDFESPAAAQMLSYIPMIRDLLE